MGTASFPTLLEFEVTIMTMQRVLFVLTSHDTLGETGQPTGFYLPEVTHPYAVFEQAGIPVDFVSPKGGKAPITGVDLTDPLNKEFLDDPAKMAAVENTLTPEVIDPSKYNAIFYSGGHGTMWDFPHQPVLDKVAAAIYEQGGVVGAVCHGPSGLLNIKLSDGSYLIAGKKVAAFTNEEEVAMKLTEVIPFFLADKLKERGATHTKADNFKTNVEVVDRLVTGQNPASAKEVGEQMVALMSSAS
jgi:putative intracellular protease/amidase